MTLPPCNLKPSLAIYIRGQEIGRKFSINLSSTEGAVFAPILGVRMFLKEEKDPLPISIT